jgi:hypothetical protein
MHGESVSGCACLPGTTNKWQKPTCLHDRHKPDLKAHHFSLGLDEEARHKESEPGQSVNICDKITFHSVSYEFYFPTSLGDPLFVI